MNESHQRVSQLLKALLQFALASVMYIYKKKVHKQFSVLKGPQGSSGLLIVFVVRVLPRQFSPQIL